jgi:polysaccharide export outer membrane protein
MMQAHMTPKDREGQKRMSGSEGKKFKMTLLAAFLFFTLLSIAAAPPPALSGDYQIGEGDTLMISVWGEKELSLSVKVRPDGKITLPALGEIMAASQTPNDLQTDLQKKLRGIVKNPVVTVIVVEVTNNKVYVFGGGISPGVYSLTGRTTLLQLLCQIGQQRPVIEVRAVSPGSSSNTSTAQIADLRNSYVIRNGKKIKKDFYDLFVNGNMSQDIVIEPNDAIFIPAFQDRNVYVMGAVTTPKSISYRDGMTVVEAILEAGGFTKFAKPNNTVIYRKEGDKEIVTPVKLKDLINDGDLRQNPRIQPGDYVVVYESIF